MVNHENVTYSNNRGISSVSVWLRDQTWLCVYCWCQTPEGVGSPRRAITRAITRSFDRWYPASYTLFWSLISRLSRLWRHNTGAGGSRDVPPFRPPFSSLKHPLDGYPNVKNTLCEIFIFSHSFGVISLKIWYPVKIHPADTPVGAYPPPPPPPPPPPVKFTSF